MTTSQTDKFTRWPFFWLTSFYFVYCARPGDWIPGLDIVPLAKITGIAAALSLVLTAGKTPRRFADLPREAYYLAALLALLLLAGLVSPISRRDALFSAIDFGKVGVGWVLTFLLITNFSRLRRIMLIQAASVAAIGLIAIVKGHSVPRLSGVIGGSYSNPNDLAFAIVLSIPFCLAFFVSAKNLFSKTAWVIGILCMLAALFLTASRAGFIDLAISGTVCLWHLGIRGRRLYLVVIAFVVGGFLFLFMGDTLQQRFAAISEGDTDSSLYGRSSYEQREGLIRDSLDAIARYPILGVGAGNFMAYGDTPKEVHVSYLEIAAEGGIPALLLYLAFFYRGFANLRRLRHNQLEPETALFVGALHSSLIGFAVGASFAPEVYEFFPYFAVCYTSVLVAMTREQPVSRAVIVRYSASGHRIIESYGAQVGSGTLTSRT